MILAAFLTLAIILSWIHTYRPGLNRLHGTVIHVEPVPLLARMRMHATGVAATVALAIALAATEPAMLWFSAIGLVSAAALVAVPVSYTITDLGIRLGLSQFRRWTEFAAVRRAPGGARLIGVSRGRGMHIWLSGSRGDDEFLQFLRQTLKGAYKGTSAVRSARLDQEPPAPEQETTSDALVVPSLIN